jgi:cysteine desulfurase
MTLNGGKIYGPKQSGILYVRAGVVLKPQVLGGGQEFGLRSGTENVAFAVGFAKALQNAVNNRSSVSKGIQPLHRDFIKKLESLGGELQGHAKLRLPNNILMTFKDADNERILFSLDEQGVWAASGSACSASKEEVSHVLTAIGLTENQARSSVRFSIGRHTTQAEIDKTIKALKTALKA